MNQERRTFLWFGVFGNLYAQARRVMRNSVEEAFTKISVYHFCTL